MKSAFVPHTAEAVLTDAVQLLGGIEEGRFTLDDALDFHLISPEFRRTTGSLLFTFFRRRKWIDRAIRSLAARPPRPWIQRLIELTLTRIWFQQGIAPESAANVAVALCGKKGSRFEANFVNALLRRRPELPQDTELNTPQTVLPNPLLTRWRERYSAAELLELTDAFLSVPPVTFRSEGQWEPGSLAACEIPGFGVFRYYEAASAEALLTSPALSKGHCYLQDPAASLAVSLIDFQPVRRMLDLCAAPGGKALCLAEAAHPGTKLTAADHSEKRQELTRENFARRGIAAEIVTADASELKGEYDLVLADVPCSNTGVIRHRPDAAWRFSGKSLHALLPLQERLLEEAARLTAPGGQLVYSTCSLEPEENQDRVAAFLQTHPEFDLSKQIQLLPTRQHDGAFAALLGRRKG